MPVFRVQVQTCVSELHTVLVETDRPGARMEELAIEVICDTGDEPDSVEVTDREVVWWEEVKQEVGSVAGEDST